MSKVQGCRLSRVGDMPFDFYWAGCNTFTFGVMLCFSYSDKQGCHS